jgi:hypothetical protein
MANQQKPQAAGPTSPLAKPESIFATTGDSGMTYEEEQAAMAWYDADDRGRPAALARLEAVIKNPDRHVEAMQWARAQGEKRKQPDGGVGHGPSPDDGQRPGLGGGRRP